MLHYLGLCSTSSPGDGLKFQLKEREGSQRMALTQSLCCLKVLRPWTLAVAEEHKVWSETGVVQRWHYTDHREGSGVETSLSALHLQKISLARGDPLMANYAETRNALHQQSDTQQSSHSWGSRTSSTYIDTLLLWQREWKSWKMQVQD